jgi:UDP-N-acetylmuramate: L-alanyl-gamma-D-glutamyl-meso-diaminopimelate ligase
LEPYATHPHSIHNGKFYLDWNHEQIQTAIFGSHNMQNIAGARKICLKAGISEQDFYQAIPGFRGAARRLECLYQYSSTAIFNDFAHAPSKVKATIQAVSQLFPHRKLVACLELHTFSSLSSEFLPQYRSTMDDADLPIVFFDPQTLIHKGLSPLSPSKVAAAFGRKDMHVFTSREELERFLKSQKWINCTLLLMSSGNFGGMDLPLLVKQVTALE